MPRMNWKDIDLVLSEAAAAIMNAPSTPAARPANVTPPLVPRGTLCQGRVIRNGEEDDKIPSSEDSVSAAAAA